MQVRSERFEHARPAAIGISPCTLLCGVAAIALMVSLAQPALADGQPAAPNVAAAPVTEVAEATTEQVLVTARHREELVQDVPLAVSVIGGLTANEEHVDRFTDLAQDIPNFTPSITNPRTSALAIRGLGGLAGGADGSESGVGLIVDNVFMTYVGFAFQDLVDLDHVEVARGPQGTLLGKNTTVGAVIIDTARPSFTPSATIETTYGNYNTVEERDDITGSLIDDVLAGRLTFYGDWGDGQIENADGKQLLNTQRFGLRGQLLFTPSDDVTDRLILTHLNSDEYNNYSGLWGNPFTHYANGTPHTTFTQQLEKLYGVTPTYSVDNPNLPDVWPLSSHTDGVSNELNWTLPGDLTLTSVTAWEHFQLLPHNTTGDYGLTELFSNQYYVNVNQYSQETRLASPAGQTVEWQVGSYVLHEMVSSDDVNIFGSDSTPLYSNNAKANPLILKGLQYDYDGRDSTTSIAEFGQATWHVDDQLTLTTGLRDTWERRYGSDNGVFFGGAQNLSTADEATRLKLLTADGFSATGAGFGVSQTGYRNSLSLLVNPSYRVSDNVLTYFSFARGEKSGAVDTTALPIYNSTSTQILGYYPVITKPEVSVDYEAGVKTNWLDNKLTLNGNLYWDDIYNYQALVTDLSYTDPVNHQLLPKTYLGNVAQVRLTGIELEGHWSPIERLHIDADATYNHAEYVSFGDAASPADQQYTGGAKVLSLSGTRLPSIPPRTANIGARYDHPLGETFGQQLSGYVYGTEFWTDTTIFSNPYSIYQLTQSPYSITNIGAGVQRQDGLYDLEFWAKNLFDKRYIIAQTLGSTNVPATETLGLPLTFGVTLRLKF